MPTKDLTFPQLEKLHADTFKTWMLRSPSQPDEPSDIMPFSRKTLRVLIGMASRTIPAETARNAAKAAESALDSEITKLKARLDAFRTEVVRVEERHRKRGVMDAGISSDERDLSRAFAAELAEARRDALGDE